MTLVFGFFCFVWMPPGPCHTASWFRGRKGWFTEKYVQVPLLTVLSTNISSRQEKIIVNRILREDPSKSSMHTREALTPRLFFQSLKDFDLWYAATSYYLELNLRLTFLTLRPIYILGLMFWIPVIPPLQYLTLSLRNLGFDTFQSNLLIIPYTIVHSKSFTRLSFYPTWANRLQSLPCWELLTSPKSVENSPSPPCLVRYGFCHS